MTEKKMMADDKVMELTSRCQQLEELVQRLEQENNMLRGGKPRPSLIASINNRPGQTQGSPDDINNRSDMASDLFITANNQGNNR